MLKLTHHHLSAIISHAKESDPHECCGIIGGIETIATTVYRTNNVAKTPLITYEAAPEQLFNAQKLMRERGEQLLAIYHSHPRSVEPTPSDTDVRLAYYPQATYLIIGLAGPQPVVRAFHISEREHRWKQVEYEIADQ